MDYNQARFNCKMSGSKKKKKKNKKIANSLIMISALKLSQIPQKQFD